VPVSVSGPLQATYWDSLDQMLAHMDVVSVNCPHTPGTFHLLSARRLRLMQPHAILVNTARGEIVDEAELAAMLAEGRLAGVGLDVYEHEPTVAVLLPHLGSATLETRVEMGEKAIINIKAFMDGHRPPDRVLLSML
jgi:glyoxylate reductase